MAVVPKALHKEPFPVRPWPARVAVASGVFIFALGVTVGAGWFFHVTSLIQFRP